MKQHITTKQLDELSEKGKKRFWNNRTDGAPPPPDLDVQHLPLLSVGEMIQFLVEKQDKDWRDLHIEMIHDLWRVGSCYDEDREDGKWKFQGYEKEELVDILWEAVKEVLEKF